MAKTLAPRGFARDRVLDAAQALFAEHGVSGTTLQMIADRLGVNKSAVYYQFHSKDDIVVAVFRPVFDDIARVVNIAEAIPSREVQREATISGLIELAVRHRRTTALVHTDPAVVGVVEAIGEFRDASRRLQAILAGPEPDPRPSSRSPCWFPASSGPPPTPRFPTSPTTNCTGCCWTARAGSSPPDADADQEPDGSNTSTPT